MIHRLALALGGLAAAAVLAYSLVREDRAALSATAEGTSVVATVDDATAAPREVVDTVYIAAPRKPRVVHVTRRARATPRPAARSTNQGTRRRASHDEHEDREREDHEREHEREHEEDDD
jgi:hypothetical protein